MASMKSGSLRELMSYTFILWGTSFMHGPLTHRDPKNICQLCGHAEQILKNRVLTRNYSCSVPRYTSCLPCPRYSCNPQMYSVFFCCFFRLAAGRECVFKIIYSMRETFLLNKECFILLFTTTPGAWNKGSAGISRAQRAITSECHRQDALFILDGSCFERSAR